MSDVEVLRAEVVRVELAMLEQPERIELLRPLRTEALARLREAERISRISEMSEAARQRRAVALAVAEAEGAAAVEAVDLENSPEPEPSLEDEGAGSEAPKVLAQATSVRTEVSEPLLEDEDEPVAPERRLTPWEREDFWRGVRCLPPRAGAAQGRWPVRR
jgi:hypothetical protein